MNFRQRRGLRVRSARQALEFVDTVGLSTKMSFLDMFRTPHSEKLHVTERFKLTADGKFLEVLVKVEDAPQDED